MRNISADLLRIICCMFVIGIHSTPNYALMVETNQPTYIILQSMILKAIVAIGLPVFFILSGWFLLNKKSNNLISEYRKRFVTLLVPFLIYAFINYYYFHTETFDKEGVRGFFKLLFESQIAIATHLWFVYVLLGIYIVLPALRIVTDAIPKNKSIHAIIFIAFICSWPLYEYQIPKIFSGYKSIIPLPRIDVWVGYFIIGGLLARVKIRKEIALKLFGLSLIIQILATWLSVNKYGLDPRPFDTGLSMFFVSCMLTIVITGIEFSNNSLSAKVITWIAPFTYGIYLMHMILLVIISKYFSIDTVVDLVAVKTLIFMPAIFFSSLIIVYVIDKLIVNKIISLLS